MGLDGPAVVLLVEVSCVRGIHGEVVVLAASGVIEYVSFAGSARAHTLLPKAREYPPIDFYPRTQWYPWVSKYPYPFLSFTATCSNTGLPYKPYSESLGKSLVLLLNFIYINMPIYTFIILSIYVVRGCTALITGTDTAKMDAIERMKLYSLYSATT